MSVMWMLNDANTCKCSTEEFFWEAGSEKRTGLWVNKAYYLPNFMGRTIFHHFSCRLFILWTDFLGSKIGLPSGLIIIVTDYPVRKVYQIINIALNILKKCCPNIANW